MANKKITDLTLHTEPQLSDSLAIVNSLETKKISYGTLYYGIRDGLISGSSQITITESQISDLSHTDISLLNSFTSSYYINSSSFDFRIDSLTSESGSYLTTASSDFADVTFTKNDGSTFVVDTTPNHVHERVINKDTITLPKGTPVYVSGSTGNAAHVYQAKASDPTRMPAAFVLDKDLNPGQEGDGLVIGFITGVNTSTFVEGVNIYVAPNGGYVDYRPTGSNIQVQKLGNVIKSDVNGSGVITGAGRSNDLPNIQQGYLWVGDSDDVATTIPSSSFVSSNNFSTYSSSVDSRITNVSASFDTTVGSLTFDQLADVQDYTASLIPNGYLPVWNSGSQEWRPGRPDFEQGKTRLFVAAARSNTSAFFFNSQTRTSDTSASPAPDSAFMLVSGDLDTIIVHLRSDTTIDITIDIFKNANGVAFGSATSTVTPITTSLVANTITTTTFTGLSINQFDSIHIKGTPSGGGNLYGIIEII